MEGQKGEHNVELEMSTFGACGWAGHGALATLTQRKHIKGDAALLSVMRNANKFTTKKEKKGVTFTYSLIKLQPLYTLHTEQ